MLATAQGCIGSWHRAGWVLTLALAELCTIGCGNTLDVLTSRRLREEPIHTLFGSDDPVDVLRNSEDSDKRVRAMLAIKEPKQNGKTEQEQNEIVQILSTSATNDPQAVCRMSAVEALARFNDPRAAQVLVTAYRNAPYDNPQEVATGPDGVKQVGYTKRTPFSPVSSYTPDVVAQIQTRVLEALGKARSPAGLALLCEVAATPAKKPEKKDETDIYLQMGTDQGAFDLRMAALRGLAYYEGEPMASDACFNIILREKDPALKGRAQASLEKITGKKAAPTAEAWAPILGKTVEK